MLRRVRETNESYQCGIWKYKTHAAALYLDIKTQVLVAVLIVSNFVINVCEKQMDPDRNTYNEFWDNAELFFNIVFALELFLNMYGFWWRPFWSSGWNVFDFVVVSVGLMDTLRINLPGPLNVLRTLRAFRVFRLFKRVQELQKIVVSLVRAVPGVLNAFLIMAIIMSIYAILAVEFYKDVGFDDQGMCMLGFRTARGNCYGDEYFGNFSKALYTLFQIMTGESWSEAVVRLVVLEHGDHLNHISAAVFFVSYIVFTAIVLINIVVAVLLDKMSSLDQIDTKEDESSQAGSGVGESGNEADSKKEELPVAEEQCPHQQRQSQATMPSDWTMQFSELGDHAKGQMSSETPDNTGLERRGGDDIATVSTERQDAENETSSFSMLSSLPSPTILPPFAGISHPQPTEASVKREQKLLDVGTKGCERKYVDSGSSAFCTGSCTEEVTALRQEVASLRSQLETVSSLLQMLVALNGQPVGHV